MVLLIDAFNVIYKFPDLEEHMHRGELVRAMRGLLQLLLDFMKAWPKPLIIHLFFDGKKKPGDETKREKISGMHVYYSHDLSADHLIKEYIKVCPSPGEIRTVSSDKDILLFAKKHRCHVQTAEEFADWVGAALAPKKKLRPEKAANPRVSDREVEYWMEMFRGNKK